MHAHIHTCTHTHTGFHVLWGLSLDIMNTLKTYYSISTNLIPKLIHHREMSAFLHFQIIKLLEALEADLEAVFPHGDQNIITISLWGHLVPIMLGVPVTHTDRHTHKSHHQA